MLNCKYVHNIIFKILQFDHFWVYINKNIRIYKNVFEICLMGNFEVKKKKKIDLFFFFCLECIQNYLFTRLELMHMYEYNKKKNIHTHHIYKFLLNK